MAVVDLGLTDIFEEAFEMAGESFHTGYDVRLARRSLHFVLDEWSNRGLNLWTIEERTQALTASTDDYTLGTDVVDVIEHVIRSTDGNTDYPIRRIAVGEYAKLSKKTQESRPTTIYVDRAATAPTITLWPVPDDTYTLVYWCLTRMEGLASGISGTPDMPARFRPALAAGIAWRISLLKQKKDLIPYLQTEHERQFELAASEDRDRANYWIRPHIGRVV